MLRLAAFFAVFLIAIVVLADTSGLGFLNALYDFQYGDKVGHFILFGTLSFLVSLATWRMTQRHRAVLLAVVAIVAIESLEELSQAWFPSRTLDVFDLAASWAGIAAGVVAAWGMWRRGQAGLVEGMCKVRLTLVKRR